MKNLSRCMRNPMNLSYLFSILFFYVLIKFQKTETGNKQPQPAKRNSLLGDLSDPFSSFPRVTPHACVNITQTFLKEAWTVVCVNDPQVTEDLMLVLSSASA